VFEQVTDRGNIIGGEVGLCGDFGVRVGKLHAVRGRAEVNLLFVSRWWLVVAGARLKRRGLHPFGFGQSLDVLRGKPEHTDRTGNVLYRLLAHIGKGERQLVPDLVVGRTRDAQPSRVAEGFETGGNIDAVPKDVVAVDDDIADIDADAEDDALVLGHARIAADHAALDYHCAPDRIDDTGKFDQRAVACGLDDTAAMTGNRPVNQRSAMGFQRLHGADLVRLHKPAVADDIGGENGRQPAHNPLFAQGSLPEAPHAKGGSRMISLATLCASDGNRSTVLQAGSVGCCGISRGAPNDDSNQQLDGHIRMAAPWRPDQPRAVDMKVGSGSV